MYVDPKKKYGKDVMLPKRALSAYFFFTGEKAPAIREQKGCTHMEAMKMASEQWNTMSEKDRKPYHDQHDKDVKRYEQQLDDLNKKGFFMMPDGTKSSDHTAKIKKKRSKSAANATESEDDAEEKPKKIKLQKEKK